ncbi:unnamed protein product [marine sediment metagenome]|uniref:Uncharacterized protein n=1 Tax=marine sediment metagenome TaxID=412755 RepID=X1GTM2_9ZZZZ
MSETESFDKTPININIFDCGTIKASFYRHLSPFSVMEILEKLPLTIRGRFNFIGPKTHWMLSQIGISVGPDSKSGHSVDKGDIVYCPQTDSVYIFIENDKLQTKMNKMGKVDNLDDLELFKRVKNGINTELKLSN